MALSDRFTSREQVLAAEERARARRESIELAEAKKRAITSEVRAWTDENGTRWEYVILDGKEARIESCAPCTTRLVIPSAIEEKPVVALAVDACSYLLDVEEIVCPDTIVLIDNCALRANAHLKKVVLPQSLATFDANWLRQCPEINHITLPGGIARLQACIFDFPHLRTLIIGAGTESVMPGTFEKSRLEHIEVDEDNPFLMSDGQALYSRDGEVLVALAVPSTRYAIRAGCKAIGKKSFSGFTCIEHIEVPDSMEILGEFAFARTSIESFSATPSLRHILQKAFFNCSKLKTVDLSEGLITVESNAFSGTSISELRLPSSVEELGTPIAAGTRLTYSGSDATFTIADGSKYLKLDEFGGLYHEEPSGKRFLRMMDPLVSSYTIQDGTAVIDETAFANHTNIVEIALPDGLREINKGAFKSCHKLARIHMPDSVERIEEEAFLDTNLESFHIPSNLEFLGKSALVTYGAHHGAAKPSLHEVTVGPGNDLFYSSSGLLLERKDRGRARVLLCTDASEVVRIPWEVNEISPYAFNDVQGVKELYLSDRIRNIGMRGLALDGLVEHIHIDLEKPIEGRDSFDIYFPDTDRGMQQLMLALTVPDHVDAYPFFEHYDNAIINASSFDAQRNAGLCPYEQCTRIVRRLLDPVFLTPSNRNMCDHVLKSNIEEMCVEVAKHDDRRTIDALLDLGYLNADNLYAVIDRIGALQDAAMTGYLLEAKRLRFNQDAIDFEL